jgi:predicted nucleic acid-binding Zn ribbon protein
MEEAEVNDDAFCILLWQANGGVVREDGTPVFDGEPVRGRCLNPGDCDRCGIMQSALANLAANGVISLWICPDCVSRIRESAQEMGVVTKFPGFYTEGSCQRPQCERAKEYGEVGRYSTLLQLLTILGATIP